MDYKEKDIQKAKELVDSKPFSTSQLPLFKDWAYDIAIQMAEYKDKEFEDLINSLPTPIKELIKAFKDD